MLPPCWRLLTSTVCGVSRVSSTTWGSAVLLPRMIGELDLRTRGACEEALPLERGHVARGARIEQSDEVAGSDARLRGRRVVARRDDPQIVLMCQRNADVGCCRLFALELPHLGLREVCAVRVEPFGKAAHGAAHDAFHIRLLDVVAHDERHDVVEHPQVRVGLVGARHRVPEETADDGEGNDRRGDENGDEART